MCEWMGGWESGWASEKVNGQAWEWMSELETTGRWAYGQMMDGACERVGRRME